MPSGLWLCTIWNFILHALPHDGFGESFFFKCEAWTVEHFAGAELTTGCQHRQWRFVSLGLWFWLSVAPGELWKEWLSFTGLPYRASPKEFATVAKRVFFILQSLRQLYFGQTLANLKPPGLRFETQNGCDATTLFSTESWTKSDEVDGLKIPHLLET